MPVNLGIFNSVKFVQGSAHLVSGTSSTLCYAKSFCTAIHNADRSAFHACRPVPTALFCRYHCRTLKVVRFGPADTVQRQSDNKLAKATGKNVPESRWRFQTHKLSAIMRKFYWCPPPHNFHSGSITLTPKVPQHELTC